MKTVCNSTQLEFQGLDSRRIVADFDGGEISSDAGLLLFRELDQRLKLTTRFADCFRDNRDASRVRHSVAEMIVQRVMGIAAGYEDLNDHETLRDDLAFKIAADRSDQSSRLAGKSTLNRLEQAASTPGRYHRIDYDSAQVEALMREVFFASYDHPPAEIVLDLDATDDRLHPDAST